MMVGVGVIEFEIPTVCEMGFRMRVETNRFLVNDTEDYSIA